MIMFGSFLLSLGLGGSCQVYSGSGGADIVMQSTEFGLYLVKGDFSTVTLPAQGFKTDFQFS